MCLLEFSILPVEQTQGRALLHPVLELLDRTLGELERLDAVLPTEAGPHDTPVPVHTVALISAPSPVVVTEAEVVSDGVGEIAGQDVRLEWVHINVNSHRSFRTNSSHACRCRLSTFERVSTSGNK